MKRREFIKVTAAAAGSYALSSVNPILAVDEQKKYANDIVTLGKTGIKVSRLAMGTGTNGYNYRSDQTRKLGIKGVADLLKSAYDHGINFWDSADQYGSHPHLKEALKYVPRDKVVVLTKTHAETAQEMREDLDRFRKEIGTDYIDIVLLHMMTREDWPDQYQGAMEELSRARERGIVRAHGVSCHTIEALETASRTDWVQIASQSQTATSIVTSAPVNYDENDIISQIESWFQDNLGKLDGVTFHFRKIDDDLGLPRGSAKKHLKQIAAKFSGVNVVREGSETILFSERRPPDTMLPLGRF